MIVDLILAAFAGIVTRSFTLFVLLAGVAAVLARPDRPLSSGLLRLAFIMLGISALFSLFDGDCDLS